MIKYIAKRILYLIPIMLIVTLIVFFLMSITPGDPARMILGETATQEMCDELREELGLKDRFHPGPPVTRQLMGALPYTLKLAVSAILLAIALGVPIGIISASRQYSIFDNTAMVLGLVGISMPLFWLGLLLILLFSVKLGWFPPSGFDSVKQMILPTVTLCAQHTAVFARMTRSSMLEIIRQDYIRTVRAKGQRELLITLSHVLRNALVPIVTVIGIQFGQLLGGAVLCETIFSINGIGRLMVEAIKKRDYPLVQGGVLFIALGFCVVNLIVDLIYAYLDPKIKSQYT